MSRTLLRMKAVLSNAAFCKQLIAVGIPMVFRWFSSSSPTVPKAPTAIGITVALTSHNFCTCNFMSLYLVISSSSFALISRNSYVDDFSFSLLFNNNYNVWSSVFYFFICLDYKVPKYFTFFIFQHWFWLMWEPFVLTFNLKFLVQEPVSHLVLVSS